MKLIWLALSALTIVAFQNCGKAPAFESSESASTAAIEDSKIDMAGALGLLTDGAEDANPGHLLAEYRIASFFDVCPAEVSCMAHPAVTSLMTIRIFSGNRVQFVSKIRYQNAFVNLGFGGWIQDFRLSVRAYDEDDGKEMTSPPPVSPQEAAQIKIALKRFLGANQLSIVSLSEKSTSLLWGSRESGYLRLVPHKISPNDK